MPDSPEDPKLAAALARLDLGPDVPPPLRAAVGAALEWVDALTAEAAESEAGPASGRHVAAYGTRRVTRPR